MEQNEVVKRIREYHIIRDVLKEKSVERIASDPNMSSLIATFSSYVEFFGKIRMSNVESFDQFFSRLERNYLASAGHEKIKPQDSAYIQYVKDILGKSGLTQVTEVANDPDNTARIRSFRTQVGREVRETNTVILARDIKMYSVVSGLRGNVTEAIRKNHNLEAELAEVRRILNITKESAKTREEVLAEMERMEEAILLSIVENAAESDYLAKAIAKSTGRKINEVRDLVIAASGASAKRDAATQRKIEDLHTTVSGLTATIGGVGAGMAGVSKSLGGVHRKLNGMSKSMGSAHAKLDGLDASMGSAHTKLDEISSKVDRLSKNKTFWKVAAGAGVGFGAGVGITALIASLMGSGGGAVVTPGTTDATQIESAYVEYMDSYDNVALILQNMLLDGDYTKDERASFEGSVDEFVAKYAGTKFETESVEDAAMLKNFSTAVEGMSEEKRVAVANYALLLTDITAVNATLETYKTQNAELIQSNKDLKASVDALTAKIGDLEAQIIKLQEVIATTDNAKTIQELQAKIEAYEKQVKGLNDEVATLTGENTQLKGENTSLKAENATLKGQVDNLTAENTQLKADIQKANGDLAAAQQTIATLTQEKADLQAKYDAGVITQKELQEKVAALEKSEKELKAQVESLTTQVTELNQKLSAEIAKYNALVEKYNALEGEKNNVASSLAAAQERIAELEAQIDSLTVDAAELIFTVYEYMTGVPTNDIEEAMKVVSSQLGITVTNPSTGLEGNVKQP